MPFSREPGRVRGSSWRRRAGSLDRASAATARDLARRPCPRADGAAPGQRRGDHQGARRRADGARWRTRASTCGTAPGRSGCPTTWTWTTGGCCSTGCRRGVPGLVPRRRLAGLRLVATDQEWSWGEGRSADRVRPWPWPPWVGPGRAGGPERPGCRRAAGPTAPPRLRSALRLPDQCVRYATRWDTVRACRPSTRRPPQRRSSRSTGR